MLEQLILLDQQFFLFLNGLNQSWLNSFMQLISGQMIWIPFIGSSLYFAFKNLSRSQFYFFFVFLGLLIVLCDSTSSYVLKNLTERFRPCKDPFIRDLIVDFGQRCGGKFGFVSSHASNSLALSLFSYLVIPMPRYIAWPLLALPLLVSFSRIYLGVHYPGDILGGIIVSVLWTSFFFYCWKNLKGQDVQSANLNS